MEKIIICVHEYFDKAMKQYDNQVLIILRDYQVQRAYIEWVLDVSITGRNEYRDVIRGLRNWRLQQLREGTQRMLVNEGLHEATLGHSLDGDRELVRDIRQFGRCEIERARRVVERIKLHN